MTKKKDKEEEEKEDEDKNIPRRGFLRSYLRYIYPEIKTIHTLPSLLLKRRTTTYLILLLSK